MTRPSRRTLFLLLLAGVLLPGCASEPQPETMRTVRLEGLAVDGCAEDCDQYLIETNFETRPGRRSRMAALPAGTVRTGGDLVVGGYDGTLVDDSGRIVGDPRRTDPGVSIVSSRVNDALFADFDQDGISEILYGLNSYSLFSSAEDVRLRQWRSFEILRTPDGDPANYRPANETFFPLSTCSGPGANCARDYEWRIDGDIVDVEVSDFNEDGWLDVAFLGWSLGDHSWVGFASDIAEAGIPLSNENGARIGVMLNGGEAAPGRFVWDRSVSPLEKHLRALYPFAADVDYAPKTHRLLAEDLDGDGHVDLVAIGDKIVAAWGTGDGSFEHVDVLAESPGGTDGAVADFDRDGHMDIFVLANPDDVFIHLPRMSCASREACRQRGKSVGGTSALYLGTGERGLVRSHEIKTGTEPTSVTATDLDADGWTELVVTCRTCLGPMRVEPVVDGTLAGLRVTPLAHDGIPGLERSYSADFDRDGDLDLVFSGSGQAFRQIWHNPDRDDARLPPGATLAGLLLVAGVAVIFGARRRKHAPRHADTTSATAERQ